MEADHTYTHHYILRVIAAEALARCPSPSPGVPSAGPNVTSTTSSSTTPSGFVAISNASSMLSDNGPCLHTSDRIQLPIADPSSNSSPAWRISATTTSALASSDRPSTAATSSSSSTPRIFNYAGVQGFEIQVNGETRFFCIQCNRDLKYSIGNVASHYNHMHNQNSIYARRRRPLAPPIPCLEDDCKVEFDSQQHIVNHYRNNHGLRGESRQLLSRYGF